MTFRPAPNDSVCCDYVFDSHWQGYAGLVHGGILATVLDGAMTRWLLDHGHAAVTAYLQVRFRHPVRVGAPVVVRAWRKEIVGPIHVMAGELAQHGVRMVCANARFIENAASLRLTGGDPSTAPSGLDR